MKNKFFQKCFISSLLIICFICATLCMLAPTVTPQQATGPDIYYYYNDGLTNAVVETADSSEFVEAIEQEETVNSVYVLDYEPYDKSFAQFTDLKASKSEVDELMRDFRQESKAYYSSKNQEFLSSMGIDENSQDYQVATSDYSPYVQITYEDKSTFQRYEDDFISEAKSNSGISEIHVTVPIALETQAAVPTASLGAAYDMSDILVDIGADDQTYTGRGINVGILEAYGVADVNHADFANIDIYAAGDSSASDDHATAVTRLLCGSNGAAKGVEAAYVYHMGYASGFIPAMNWFLDSYCTVINASLGFSNQCGEYTWSSAFMDYQVRYNRIIFIASAGNDGEKTNYYVNPPGTGYNAITVANTTKDKYIIESSSYGVESDLNMNKPTLSAPGTNIYIGSDNLGIGTSLSAPIVAGVVVKLLEERPTLRIFPEIMSAILIASSTNAERQNNKWDKRAGAGIVNYKRAREVMNNTCTVFYNPNNTVDSVVASIEAITIKKGQTIRAVAIWSANSTTKAWGDSAKSNIHTNYDMYFAYGTTTLLQSSGLTNMEFISYKVSLASQSTIRIDLKQAGARTCGNEDYGAIAWHIG